MGRKSVCVHASMGGFTHWHRHVPCLAPSGEGARGASGVGMCQSMQARRRTQPSCTASPSSSENTTSSNSGHTTQTAAAAAAHTTKSTVSPATSAAPTTTAATAGHFQPGVKGLRGEMCNVQGALAGTVTLTDRLLLRRAFCRGQEAEPGAEVCMRVCIYV